MNRTPRLLDLFCGAGGASMGYSRAGFAVTGVDIKAQPHYPFTFQRADALEYVQQHGHEYDVIAASPPCQRYSICRTYNPRIHETVDLVEPVRTLLIASGKPYIIENVRGAPLLNPIVLCGQMFGLRVLRHRLFESSIFLLSPPHMKHRDYIPFNHTYERAFADAMGVTWASNLEARQCVPPAYTEYIGNQLSKEMP